MNVKDRVESLIARYKFDIHEFMDAYKANLSREVIAEKLGLSFYSTKQILARLMLPVPKTKRPAGYRKFYAEYASDEDHEPNEELVRENDYLGHKLDVSERAIQRSRDEANHLRGVLRIQRREDSLHEQILDIVSDALPIKRSGDIKVMVQKPAKKYDKHVAALLLSDIHAEESVVKADVGETNEFNWDILTKRLEYLFNTFTCGSRGEKRAIVFILGDVISGVIHDILEGTVKPTAEAVHDLADLIAEQLLVAQKVYGNIEVLICSGNHERLTDRIKSNSKGFDFGYLFGQILKAKVSGNKNIDVEISTTGHVSVKVGDIVIGGMHGDLYRGTPSEARSVRVIQGFKNVLGVDVNHILQGHVHQFQVYNTYAGTYICNGSVIGSNAYGVTNGFLALRPNQTIIGFEPDGEIEFVKQVFLDRL